MAHHIFEFSERALRMHDADVALVRHFLELGALRLGNEAVVVILRKWEWAGPGVWLNVDEASLASHPEVFSAAAGALAEHGQVVRGQYISKNVASLVSAQDRLAELIRNEIQNLRGLLQPGA